MQSVQMNRDHLLGLLRATGFYVYKATFQADLLISAVGILYAMDPDKGGDGIKETVPEVIHGNNNSIEYNNLLISYGFLSNEDVAYFNRASEICNIISDRGNILIDIANNGYVKEAWDKQNMLRKLIGDKLDILAGR